jgi:hypothetical protein
MSHRSRVCAVIIDVDSSSYEAAAHFWSGALGRDLNFDPKERYTAFRGEFDYFVQTVEPGREGVHIDIETDDVEAEAARLEKLGARRRNRVKSWWVMIAPDGQTFCVVPVQSQTWPQGAVEWD